MEPASPLSLTRAIGAAPVTAVCAPWQEALAGDVLTTLERIAPQDPMRPGLKVRFGWSLLTLQAAAGGGLVICEPDFDRDPLRDTRPRLDTTLEVLARQAALVRRVGVVPVDTGFEQFVMVVREALSSTVLNLSRGTPAEEDDSGWTLSSPDHPGDPDDPDAFDALRAFLFLRRRPIVWAALALPAGYTVAIEAERITAVFDPAGRRRL